LVLLQILFLQQVAVVAVGRMEPQMLPIIQRRAVTAVVLAVKVVTRVRLVAHQTVLLVATQQATVVPAVAVKQVQVQTVLLVRAVRAEQVHRLGVDPALEPQVDAEEQRKLGAVVEPEEILERCERPTEITIGPRGMLGQQSIDFVHARRCNRKAAPAGRI
jgi:hypothetical protein